MRKRGVRKGQWIFWVVAFFGWFAPAGVLATSENLLVNGDFAADGGGWSGASGGGSCSKICQYCVSNEPGENSH